jgi:hypothetical protein
MVQLSDGNTSYTALKEGTDITTATMPAGGSSGRGWLSGIWKLISDRLPILGQTTMASATPVVIASNQTTIPVNIQNSSVTVKADTLINQINAFKVDGSAVTQPISGSVSISNTTFEIANDIGNPIPVNGIVTVSNTGFLAYLEAIYNSTLPTITNGNKANLQLSSRGELLTSFVDFVSNAINITATDAGSTSIIGADGQVIYSGTPTANSFVAMAVSGDSSFAIQVDGAFIGTLQFERSMDNGSTYTAVAAFAAGTPYLRSTTTQVGRWRGSSASANSIRVRATSWTSGTANIRILTGAGTGAIAILNPIRLFDQISGSQATIKSASTKSLLSDTAIVVEDRDIAANRTAIATDGTSGDKVILTPSLGRSLRISSLYFVANSIVGITLKATATAFSGAMQLTSHAADYPKPIALAVDQTFVINISVAVAINGYIIWWEV